MTLAILVANNSDLLMFSNLGRVYRLRAHQIPKGSKQAKGIPVVNILPLNRALKEKVTFLLNLNDYDNGSIIFVTEKGITKKTLKSEFHNINRNGKIAISLDETDRLMFVKEVHDSTEVVIGASNGKVVRFRSDAIRNTGRSSRGVIGMQLTNSKVVGCSTSLEGNKILAIGTYGFGKITDINSYRITNRGSKGVKTINIEKAGNLVCLKVISGNEDILIITKKGIVIRILSEQIKETISRSSKGVRIIKLREKDLISNVALFKNNPTENEPQLENEEVKVFLN